MSKSAPENQNAAPETSVPSTSGVTNMPPIEHQLLIENVNDHVEKKNGLSYLSWAWAWQEALKADPQAHFRVRTFEIEGVERCWMDVNGTAIVWMDVYLGGKTRECFLPVMDHRNKPIQNPDAFQINTALMRCLTKCLALFGLGLYIYAGEDLPETRAEDSPPSNTAAETKRTIPDIPDQEKADLTLFAERLIDHLPMHETEADLRSYWKSNQTTIDDLKQHLPALFKQVQERFSAAKIAIKEKANEQSAG